MFQRTKVPEPFRSGEQKFQGAKGLGSEWAGSESCRERIGQQGPIGKFTPGSELA